MKIALLDVDSHNYPNLPLMKISAYHKARGDTVEWLNYFEHYDIAYVSKVFGDEYSKLNQTVIDANTIIYGGTGFAIDVVDGKEVFRVDKHGNLPDEIEHIYPDYSLYPEYAKNRAFGFLTRGCPNNCDFCIVSKKEGRISHKVADLSEWWRGQKNIDLLDANILACKDRTELLQQLIDSKAKVNFSQGLDARFITYEVAEQLNQVKKDIIHFAWDFMKNEKAIIKGLKTYQEVCKPNPRNAIVYMLTNYDTTFEQDLYRVYTLRDLGFTPDVRIYRKNTASVELKRLQRWVNNRFIFRKCERFEDYDTKGKGKGK